MKNNKKINEPCAWIVSTNDRGRKSIKNNNRVYLKDKEGFEIELYNPLTDSVLADIKVNGSSVSKSGLVIRPGERFYLDCFVDDKKKFVFNTYEVEDIDQSKEAIQKNGTVEVYFYKEDTINLKNWRDLFQPIIEKHYYPVYYPYYQPRWYPSVWYGTTTGGVTLTNTIGTTTTNISLNNSGGTSNAYYSSSDLGNMTFTSNYSDDNIGSINTKIETGRVEKGESSNQQFVSVEMDFQKYHISAVAYQILPESQKPVETKEIAKKSKKQKIKDLEAEVEELKKMVQQLAKK